MLVNVLNRRMTTGQLTVFVGFLGVVRLWWCCLRRLIRGQSHSKLWSQLWGFHFECCDGSHDVFDGSNAWRKRWRAYVPTGMLMIVRVVSYLDERMIIIVLFLRWKCIAKEERSQSFVVSSIWSVYWCWYHCGSMTFCHTSTSIMSKLHWRLLW